MFSKQSICSKCLIGTVKPLRCPKCKVSIYCSRKCQKGDRDIHKPECDNVKYRIGPLLGEKIWSSVSSHDGLHAIIQGLLAQYPNDAVVCDIISSDACPSPFPNIVGEHGKYLCRLTTISGLIFSEMRNASRNGHLDSTIYKGHRGAVYNILHNIGTVPIFSTVGLFGPINDHEAIAQSKRVGFDVTDKPPIWLTIRT